MSPLLFSQPATQYHAQAAGRLAARRAEEAECTFQPDTGNAYEVLAASTRAPQLAESREDFVARLAAEGERKQAVLQAIDNVHRSRLTFRPRINERSRAVRTSHAALACPLPSAIPRHKHSRAICVI